MVGTHREMRDDTSCGFSATGLVAMLSPETTRVLCIFQMESRLEESLKTHVTFGQSQHAQHICFVLVRTRDIPDPDVLSCIGNSDRESDSNT